MTTWNNDEQLSRLNSDPRGIPVFRYNLDYAYQWDAEIQKRMREQARLSANNSGLYRVIDVDCLDLLLERIHDGRRLMCAIDEVVWAGWIIPNDLP